MIESSRIRDCVEHIYDPDQSGAITNRIVQIVERHRDQLPRRAPQALTERDAMLITYPDQVQEEGEAPLLTLDRFARHYLTGLVNRIHILPFYPSSSDDGFSVVDYRSVDGACGNWADIRRLAESFGLTFDAVVNHASVQSGWFRGYLSGEARYQDYFVAVEGSPDLSAVVRPRTLRLLTKFQTAVGPRAVWTTFSADQADLNYGNPEVLIEVIDLVLFYVSQGASCLRLDAVAYIWKEIGTSCIHRPQVHWIIRLLRAVLDAVAPHVLLLTETNVAQAENLSYISQEVPEADLVYNFGLPPLVLHAFHAGDVEVLSEWADNLLLPVHKAASINILATHDGIGLNGARGILSDVQIQAMLDRIEAAGGRISSRSNADGSTSAYEINANYYDALGYLAGEDASGLDAQRFLTAHAIMFALKGVPGIYFHSLFGSRGWQEGVSKSGQARTINRQKAKAVDLRSELAAPASLRAQIYGGMKHLLELRRKTAGFAPDARQIIPRGGGAVLAVARTPSRQDEQVLCLHNVTAHAQEFDCGSWNFDRRAAPKVLDLLSQASFLWDPQGTVRLQPYQSMWLRMMP